MCSWVVASEPRLLVAAALALTCVGVSQADGLADPYTLVDPGAFGGPESFLNLPGFRLTAHGALLGTSFCARCCGLCPPRTGAAGALPGAPVLCVVS